MRPRQYVIPLRNLTRAQTGLVGSKAANLGELINAGFRVPEGFVLTTEAFRRFQNVNELDSSSSQEATMAATMPSDLQDILRDASSTLGDTPLAVRSSGVDEDLAGASFAGQYETILNVVGFDALISAVRRCWASAFSERVSTYLAEKGDGRKGEMAVLVQHLVQADSAGVAFSANPVTGDRQECVVNAVHGLGERLVSGQSTPDEWVVRGREAICRNAPENAITASQVLEVAEMTLRAESHFTTPQDIEWAIADGELYMLQARPITALPEPAPKQIQVPVEVPLGFWEREATHFPEPLSPMLRSAVLPEHEKALYRSMKKNSMPIEGVQFREIGGWLYQRMVPLGGKDRAPPPAWLMPLLIRLEPSLRKRVKGLVNFVKTDKPGRDVERWYNEWKPKTIERINQFKIVNLESLSDAQLEEHLKKTLDFMKDCLNIHALITTADIIVAELAVTCQELLGWDGRKSLELLSGLSSKTTEPTLRLNELVRLAEERPEILRLLNQVDNDADTILATADPKFAAAFDSYMKEFGYRTLRWDLHEKTLLERPELVLRLIRDQLSNDYDYKVIAINAEKIKAEVIADARQILSNRSTQDNERFERTLSRAERAYPIREEHEFYLSNTPLALLRYALLEIGERLTDNGLLEQRNDVFFLEKHEAQEAFRENIDHRGLINQRKGELEWAKAHPGPAFYGETPPPLPSMDAFPSEVKRVMKNMIWMLESLFAAQYIQEPQTVSTDALRGLAASPGQYTGSVRVIMGETEFLKLRPGDVLVCPTTQPSWSILFPNVGALVTDSGGILSHPAIVAREYHIPAVVATGKATSVLKDGQLVTVDGNSGSVLIKIASE